MPETENDQPTIQQLRERADKARELEATNAAMARENAFLKAGINPEQDPRLGYFVRGYDGDLTSEAIKTAATEAGFLADPVVAAATVPAGESTEEAPPVSDEQHAQDQLATQVPAEAAGAGAQREVELMDEGFSEFHKAMQSGSDRRDAASHVIGRAIAQGLGKA